MDEIRFVPIELYTYYSFFSLLDSYLENQRRRTLRDVQGYYFPYKKYTLKDYKDLQKLESQHNPYASVNEITVDRVYIYIDNIYFSTKLISYFIYRKNVRENVKNMHHK